MQYLSNIIFTCKNNKYDVDKYQKIEQKKLLTLTIVSYSMNHKLSFKHVVKNA